MGLTKKLKIVSMFFNLISIPLQYYRWAIAFNLFGKKMLENNFKYLHFEAFARKWEIFEVRDIPHKSGTTPFLW